MKRSVTTNNAFLHEPEDVSEPEPLMPPMVHTGRREAEQERPQGRPPAQPDEAPTPLLPTDLSGAGNPNA